MNLQTLKELFLLGPTEDVDAFVENLKPRCIQVSDRRVEGLDERLVENTENHTFFDRHMNVYRECPVTHQLTNVNDMVTVTILKDARRRPEGARNYIKTETLSRSALESHEYVVPLSTFTCGSGTDHNPTSSERYLDSLRAWNGYHGETQGDEPVYAYIDNPRVYKISLNYDTDVDCYLWNAWQSEFKHVESLGDDNRFHEDDRNHLYHIEYTDVVYDGNNRPHYVLKSVINASPETYHRCSSCNRYYVGSDCPSCSRVQIYSYHGWNGELSFKLTEEDIANGEKMFFGCEIETENPVSVDESKNCIKPYQDIWHLMLDGSLAYGRSFEMISQPMTYNYIIENQDRFKTMFDSLIEAGQVAHNTQTCGLHIHVSYAAFKDEEAVSKAVCLVNGFREQMELFARRRSGCYNSYSNLNKNFSKADADCIPKDGHGVCVNVTNRHNPRKATVEFRLYKSTLNFNTWLAAIEFTRNIVNMANSDQLIVKFGDLLKDGDHIPTYIEQREQNSHRQFNREEKMSFVNFKYFDKVQELLSGEMTLNEITEFFRNIPGIEEGTPSSDTEIVTNDTSVTIHDDDYDPFDAMLSLATAEGGC